MKQCFITEQSRVIVRDHFGLDYMHYYWPRQADTSTIFFHDGGANRAFQAIHCGGWSLLVTRFLVTYRLSAAIDK
jgi:hypothetical protein